jgi:prepilin-type processing-associated H-X9-DG protein
MRQLMLAVTMYASENQGYMPFCNWGGPGSAITANGGTIYDYGWLFQTSTCSNPALKTDVENGVLYKYVSGGSGQISTTDVFHCPLWDPTADVGAVNSITSYTMDGAACGFGALQEPPFFNQHAMQSFKISSIHDGSEKVLLWEGDDNGKNNPFNDGASYPSEETLATRHGTGKSGEVATSSTSSVSQSGLGANVAYLDTHVEFMHASQFLIDSASDAPDGRTGYNELWWNPLPSTTGGQATGPTNGH